MTKNGTSTDSSGDTLRISKNGRLIKTLSATDFPNIIAENCESGLKVECAVSINSPSVDPKNDIIYFSVMIGTAQNIPMAVYAFDGAHHSVRLVIDAGEIAGSGMVSVSPDGNYLAYDGGYHGGYCNNSSSIEIYDLKTNKSQGSNSLSPEKGDVKFEKWNNGSSFTYIEYTYSTNCEDLEMSEDQQVKKTYTIK